MNVCIFTGRTTEDVELRYTNDGKAIGRFSLAIDDGYGDKKYTSFFGFTAFGKTAESLNKYVSKGTKISVRSRARQDRWQNKDGQNRSSVGFLVDEWEFAQTASFSGTAKPAEPKEPQAQDDFMDIPDDLEGLPFN